MLKQLLKIILYLFCLLLLAAVFLGFFLYKEIGISDDEPQKYLQFSYFDDKKAEFKSYANTDIAQFKDIYSYLKFYLSKQNAPKQKMPMIKKSKNDFSQKPENLAFYWLGHSSYLAELNGLRVLIDPVFDNASPFMFAKPRFAPPPIERWELPKLDIIIITHNHYDHLERKSLQTLFARHFIVPLGLKSTLIHWGVDEDKITELAWGDESEISGLKIIAQSGIHYSGRSPFDKNKSLWNNYILSFADKKIFFGGDSGYGTHYTAARQKYGDFDLAFLGIDGWGKTRAKVHLNPKEALKASADLGAKALVPTHWGVFNSGRDWKDSIDFLYKNRGEVKVIAAMMGERFDDNSSTKPWWQEVK